MEIIRKINNNVALARDAKGRELVVFGKGVGFPSMPYELDDLSCIQRSFYDVNEKYFDLLRDVPQEVFLAADDIADAAREELSGELNPNLTYTLADHLNFAIQRCRDGITIQTPLAYDIRHLYPQEYTLAKEAVHELREKLNVPLPDSEAASIAMHLITAEAEGGNMHTTVLTTKIITEISALVEKGLDFKLDTESFSFSRFAMHLRYLVERMIQGQPLPSDSGLVTMFNTIRMEYPEVYACVLQIDDFLDKNYGWHCSKEEQFYLIMHIHRVYAERTEG